MYGGNDAEKLVRYPAMSRSGLTIVELLTVIAIVAVLTGIALPIYGSVRRRAHHTVCADNLRQLGLAVTL